ncbi:VIT1/CCC1 transporter family protein [Mesorhizobium sp. ZMM04-4]
MVLTFTLSIGVTETGQDDVRAVLFGALGCNLAWGIIDAVMYVMGVRGERSLGAFAIDAIRSEQDPVAARALIADHLPPAILPALQDADLERIRVHLALPSESIPRPGRLREDALAAVGVFLLVFLCVFPVVLPFVFFEDVALAIRTSNVIAVLLLFFTGFTFGLSIGKPWRTGTLMVAIGVAMVAVAMALGG